MRSDDRADDRPLIARIARRDATALERLYALYRPRLWRYLWQQLDGDAGAVEDILQEGFLAVWLAEGYKHRGAKVYIPTFQPFTTRPALRPRRSTLRTFRTRDARPKPSPATQGTWNPPA